MSTEVLTVLHKFTFCY